MLFTFMKLKVLAYLTNLRCGHYMRCGHYISVFWQIRGCGLRFHHCIIKSDELFNDTVKKNPFRISHIVARCGHYAIFTTQLYAKSRRH